MKKILAILFLLMAGICEAQITNVIGTIADSTGAVYANGSVKFTFNGPSPVNINGQSTNITPQTFPLDGNGVLNGKVYDLQAIPGGASYTMQGCASDGRTCATVTSNRVTGGSYNVSQDLTPAIMPLLSSAGVVSSLVGLSGKEGQQVFLVESPAATPGGLYFYHNNGWHFSGGPFTTGNVGNIGAIVPTALVEELDWDVVGIGGFNITGAVGGSQPVTTLYFPNFTTLGLNADVDATSNSALTSILMPKASVFYGGNAFDFDSNALTPSSIATLLHQFTLGTVLFAGSGGVGVDVSQQTPPAYLTGQAVLDKKTLIATGNWTVSTDVAGFSVTGGSQGSKTFVMAGNQTTYFPATSQADVVSSSCNNGTYTVSTAVFTTVTTLTVTQSIPCSTFNGTIQQH